MESTLPKSSLELAELAVHYSRSGKITHWWQELTTDTALEQTPLHTLPACFKGRRRKKKLLPSGGVSGTKGAFPRDERELLALRGLFPKPGMWCEDRSTCSSCLVPQHWLEPAAPTHPPSQPGNRHRDCKTSVPERDHCLMSAGVHSEGQLPALLAAKAQQGPPLPHLLGSSCPPARTGVWGVSHTHTVLTKSWRNERASESGEN